MSYDNAYASAYATLTPLQFCLRGHRRAYYVDSPYATGLRKLTRLRVLLMQTSYDTTPSTHIKGGFGRCSPASWPLLLASPHHLLQHAQEGPNAWHVLPAFQHHLHCQLGALCVGGPNVWPLLPASPLASSLPQLRKTHRGQHRNNSLNMLEHAWNRNIWRARFITVCLQI